MADCNLTEWVHKEALLMDRQLGKNDALKKKPKKTLLAISHHTTDNFSAGLEGKV